MASLSIDTSDNKKIIVALGLEKKTIQVKKGFIKSEICLSLIDELCKKNKISVLSLKAVKVNIGPGSYTGLRVGTAISNALGFLLKIPINGKKIGERVFPVYN